MSKQEDSSKIIPLVDIITALRSEIDKAQKALKESESDVVFNLNDIEVELNTVVTREGSAGASGGIKFGVFEMFNAKLEGKLSKAKTQKLTFRLSPESKKSGERIQVSGDDDRDSPLNSM